MSRIGKQLITLPSGVEISVTDRNVTVKGPKGTLHHMVPACATVDVTDGIATVKVENPENVDQNMLWGTTASILSNMVEGVSKGYSKELEINGVGFKAALSGKKITLNLGFSHPVEYTLPEGIDGEVEKNRIKVSGIDKQLVGMVAAQIRGLKKPEPYKGKGIKYVGEVIRRKAGKAAAGE